MSDILATDLTTRFPELDATTVATYLAGINLALPCMYGGVYGVNACDNEIILNLAAHLLVLDSAATSSPVNSIASKSVGSVSVSYSVGDITNNALFFNATRYGQRFMMLVSKNSVGGFFV